MLTAIEAYNRPSHEYREETFVILALNAWELLLKALILKHSNNSMKAISVYETRMGRTGLRTKKRYVKRNRSGNIMTIGLDKALNIIEASAFANLDEAFRDNLEGLSEVRDNAVHFYNNHPEFSKTVQELGAATLINYIKCVEDWFAYDLSRYNFYLMPLAFFRASSEVTAIGISAEEKRVVRYLAHLHLRNSELAASEFSVMAEMHVQLKRAQSPAAFRLAYGTEKDAIPVLLSDQEFLSKYPWDYATQQA